VRVLVIDNLDSFTHSLVQQLLVLGAEVTVARDALPADARDYALILLSPGPGRPEDHPASVAALATLPAPVFGVCLGMQGIALRFGGVVGPAREVVHGRTRRVYHRGESFLAGLPSPFAATRYHSLAVRRLPPELAVLARSRDGEVMALRHRSLPIAGVQFHPESVRSQHGLRLMRNMLQELGRSTTA
jgi:para-aminobenzoate synthetase component II